MKKRTTIILSAFVALISTTVGMAAVTFSDINNVPWDGAKAYITKVADLGLMVGQDNGNGTSLFRAKDKVTYCETVQLAYNVLKNQKLASDSDSRVTKWKPAMEGYKIPSWAYQSVSYGLENNIVSLMDLSGFVKNSTVGNNATREDVSVIFGRALSSQYKVKNEPMLKFKDKNKISSVAAPYVGLLSELNILVGDNEQNFNPKQYINRAEMAVVTTKVYSVLSGEKIEVGTYEVTGTVISVANKDPKFVVELKLSNGTTVTLSGVKDTPTTYKDKKANFADITAGDNLTLTYSGENVTKAVVNFDFLESSETSVSGTINYMTNEKITIDKLNGTSSVYVLSPLVSIKLNDEEAAVNKITRIIDNGVEVNVTAKLSGGVVTAVTAQGLENTVQGTITKINVDEITIKRSGGTSKTYAIANDISVKYEGETSRIKDIETAIKQGIEISVTAKLNDGADVNKITATVSKAGGSYTGVIKKLSEQKITMIDSKGDSNYYNFKEDPIVTFEGSEISLYKLVSKFEEGTDLSATIYLDSQQKVSKIVAKLEDSSKGTITSVTEKYITIKTASGVDRKLLLDEDVVVKLTDGTVEKLKYLMDVYEPGKTDVTLTINNKDVVVKIIANIDIGSYDIVSGEISKIGTDSLKIGSKTIYLSSKTVVTVDGEKSSVEDLYKRVKDGETLSARVAFSDDMARTIAAKVEGTKGRVTNMEKGKLTINTAGGIKTYILADDADLVIRIGDSKNKYTFSEFYSLWYISKNNYDVELSIEGGKVVRILATNA